MSFYGNARGPFDWSLCLNLKTVVGSQQSLQVLGAPRKTAKCIVTTKVTTNFSVSRCTPISYVSFLHPHAVSRFKEKDRKIWPNPAQPQ